MTPPAPVARNATIMIRITKLLFAGFSNARPESCTSYQSCETAWRPALQFSHASNLSPGPKPNLCLGVLFWPLFMFCKQVQSCNVVASECQYLHSPKCMLVCIRERERERTKHVNKQINEESKTYLPAYTVAQCVHRKRCGVCIYVCIKNNTYTYIVYAYLHICIYVCMYIQIQDVKPRVEFHLIHTLQHSSRIYGHRALSNRRPCLQWPTLVD